MKKFFKYSALSLLVVVIISAIAVYLSPSASLIAKVVWLNLQETTEFEIKGNELWMNNIINSQTYDQLVEILDNNPQINTLVEEDVIGSIDDETMIKVAYLVRERGLNTKLLAHSRIDSGGVDLFLAGVERTMERGAHIGVHSWSDGTKEAKAFPKDDPEHEKYSKYTKEMLGRDDFYWFTIYAAPAAEIHEMSEEEIQKYGIITQPIQPSSETNLQVLPGTLADKLNFYGNLDSDTVIVNAQGGPMTTLDDDEMLSIFQNLDKEKYMFVNVQQAHTYEPYKYVEPISFDFAKESDQKTTKFLAQAVKFFKNQGKKVYVVGISFGAFVVQDLLATQGAIADGYVIMVGRLDMPKEVWQEFSNGNYVGFNYKEDGTYTIVEFSIEEAGMGGGDLVSDQNMAKIAAGLGYKRYSQLLRNVDLSKVVYAYGTRDEQVGVLSPQEIQFLKSKNVEVLKGENLDHSETVGNFFDKSIQKLFARY